MDGTPASGFSSAGASLASGKYGKNLEGLEGLFVKAIQAAYFLLSELVSKHTQYFKQINVYTKHIKAQEVNKQ